MFLGGRVLGYLIFGSLMAMGLHPVAGTLIDITISITLEVRAKFNGVCTFQDTLFLSIICLEKVTKPIAIMVP